MLPLTVSFETVLQIFNNNFKQEDVKVGLFPNMRKGDFVHSRTKPRCKLRTRAAGLCAPCLISPHFPITCVFEVCFSYKYFSYTNALWGYQMISDSQLKIRWHICLPWQYLLKEHLSWVRHFKCPYSLIHPTLYVSTYLCGGMRKCIHAKIPLL